MSEAGAAWLAGSDAARRDDSQPATRPVRSRPAAPRPGPSGRTKATPGRTLWPEPGPTADSLRDVESDPAGAAPAPVAVPFDPFSQASPRGLSPADRQALALSAAIPVAAAVAPATEVEPPAARTGGPASVETVPAEPPAAETEPPAAAEAVSPPTAPPFPGQSDVGSPGPFSGDVDEPGPATSWPTWSSLD
ncbi:MAG: hypothetical protein LBK42_13110 [Propionibacteriaceae bacterium]|nr:hypothetical protein [Propionibacteriaceae bacterium]